MSHSKCSSGQQGKPVHVLLLLTLYTAPAGHTGAGETFDASTPAAYMLYVSDAVHAHAAPHKLGGSGYSVSVLDAVVTHPHPHHVSWEGGHDVLVRSSLCACVGVSLGSR